MFDTFPQNVPIALPQSQAYVRALSHFGADVQRLNIGDGYGQAVMQMRSLPVLGRIGLISRGPLWSGVPDWHALTERLRSLRHPVILNVENPAHQALRDAGFFPLMTPVTLAILPLKDLNLRQQMHQKWRNRLRKAEAAPLKVKRAALPSDVDHWLLSHETAQRRLRGYRGLPPAFACAFTQANPHKAQLFTATLKNSPVAAMLFLRHGTMASYHMGYSAPAGRALNAHNLLLFRAADWLSRHGTDLIDLGTLDTVHASGLARFKLGSGARAKTLGGTWLYGRKLAAVAKYL